MNQVLGVVELVKAEAARIRAGTSTLFPPPPEDFPTIPESMPVLGATA
jgi:hypothetical protein